MSLKTESAHAKIILAVITARHAQKDTMVCPSVMLANATLSGLLTMFVTSIPVSVCVTVTLMANSAIDARMATSTIQAVCVRYIAANISTKSVRLIVFIYRL